MRIADDMKISNMSIKDGWIAPPELIKTIVTIKSNPWVSVPTKVVCTCHPMKIVEGLYDKERDPQQPIPVEDSPIWVHAICLCLLFSYLFGFFFI